MEFVTETLFAAPAYAAYGGLIVKGDFKPSFKLPLGLKDMRLALAAGERLACRCPSPASFATTLSMPSAMATQTRIGRQWRWSRAGAPDWTGKHR